MAKLRGDNSEIVQYDSGEVPVYLRAGILSEYPNFREVAHWHNDIELIVVLEGGMQFNVNGSILTLSRGEGIFVNSKQVHYGFSDRTECNFLCMLFDPFSLPLSERLTEQYLLPVTENERCPYLLLDGSVQGRQISDAVRSLYQQRTSGTFGLRAAGCCLELLANIYELARKEGEISHASRNVLLLKRMLSFIEAHYREKLTLEILSAACRISKSTCCNIFKQYLYKTPVAYLIDYRLHRAETLLTTTDLSVTDIGFETGFQSVSFFIETFRKKYGVSPNRFRKLQRERPSPRPDALA